VYIFLLINKSLSREISTGLAPDDYYFARSLARKVLVSLLMVNLILFHFLTTIMIIPISIATFYHFVFILIALEQIIRVVTLHTIDNILLATEVRFLSSPVCEHKRCQGTCFFFVFATVWGRLHTPPAADRQVTRVSLSSFPRHQKLSS